MQKTVGERAGHGGCDGAVAGPVACRADIPAVRHFVKVSEPPVEDEFVGGDLKGAVGGGQFIEKDDAFALFIARPFGGNAPFNTFPGRNGQAADVHGFTLGEANVDKVHAVLFRHFADDGGFAQSGRAPDHQRGKFVRGGFAGPQGFKDIPEQGFQTGNGHCVVQVDCHMSPQNVDFCSFFRIRSLQENPASFFASGSQPIFSSRG